MCIRDSIDVMFNVGDVSGVGWMHHDAVRGWQAPRTPFADAPRDTIAFLTSPSPGRLTAYYKGGGSLISQQ